MKNYHPLLSDKKIAELELALESLSTTATNSGVADISGSRNTIYNTHSADQYFFLLRVTITHWKSLMVKLLQQYRNYYHLLINKPTR